MSCIVKQKIGDKVYLYESISYRNSKGQPRNKRTIIGKIDTNTGQPRYKPEYLDRLASTGRHSEIRQENPLFTKDDIRNSKIRDIGAVYLFQKLAEEIGLLDTLSQALPGCWKEVFNLVSYLICTGEPFAYFEDWLENTEAYPVGEMTSQRISELLSSISKEQRDRFYQVWCALRTEKEYLALDITSVSSYSELIENVEWGYNRDGENLRQINSCLLMGYQSRLPIYQTVYNGSLKDVSTLQTTLRTFQALAGQKPIIAVMDKGFYSKKNIDAMLDTGSRVNFLIAVPFTNKLAKDMVTKYKTGIDTLDNTIVFEGKESLRAVTTLHKWDKEHELYTHVYYNPRKALNAREDLYSHVATLRDAAMEQPLKYLNNPEYTRYLSLSKQQSEKDGEKYTVSMKKDVIEAELLTAGWMVILSDYVKTAKEAIMIYRGKDIAEKGFQRLKNNLDMDRIRVHSYTSMQNKIFICFLSLILISAIHNVMSDKKLYVKMSMKKLILIMSKLKTQSVNGQRIIYPLTKEQKTILDAFGMHVPL